MLNQEIEILFSKRLVNIIEQDELFETCLESLISHDFILSILWKRVYVDPIVMKFISLRYSNYATNTDNLENRRMDSLKEKIKKNSLNIDSNKVCEHNFYFACYGKI